MDAVGAPDTPAEDTLHTLRPADARNMPCASETADLVVTSPPYPMIQMWDSQFTGFDPAIGELLSRGDGVSAWRRMHVILDGVWENCAAALRPGGFACINIGDATRAVGNEFSLYSNHARITAAFEALGLRSLPVILWRKSTNAPNKFMGSGMLPAGAYVTLEHEYILVFRKGGPRRFVTPEDKLRRRRSAYFWEERNEWFSDQWRLGGVRQNRSGSSSENGMRLRSGAFPVELPLRLILMYSVAGDLVLDPFVGTGTSMLAAAACARNSLGVESSPELAREAESTLLGGEATCRQLAEDRIAAHRRFVEQYLARGGTLLHRNAIHGFPVKTSQEREIHLRRVTAISAESAAHGTEPAASVTESDRRFRVRYGEIDRELDLRP